MPPIKIVPPPYVPSSDDYSVPCATAPDLFFPPDRQERQTEMATRVAAARAVCLGCAIRTTCGDWAREHHEWGIWGGRTEAEHDYRPTTRRLKAHRTAPTEATAA
ncbi:WhiB family transcriptional regulator [Streptomyces syringium]|uniref:WhiB family transcriptional regulator n=1 Tax=Streptomyces syringium TaxID=76729 RepID=UPI003451B09E